MNQFDLDSLSLKELKQLQKDVARAIANYEERQKAEARLKLDALARDLGYSLADLVVADARPTKSRGAAKFRHPENPAQTWSGRGRKPQWFVDALAAGIGPDDLAIG